MSEPKKKKTVFKIVSDVLFGLFIGTIALFVISSFVQKRFGRTIIGRQITWIITGSMEPTIPQQSYVLQKTYKGEEIETGDIITFVYRGPNVEEGIQQGDYITHRVKEVTEDGYFITKGDNNRYEDQRDDDFPEVSKDDVVALYVRNMPLATFVGRFYATPAGYATTLSIIAVLIGGWFVIDLKQQKKDARKELIEEMVQEEVKRLEEEAKNNESERKEKK